MTEDEFLKKRLSELAEKSYRGNVYTFSNFLSVSQEDLFYRCERELSYATPELFGGLESSERKVLRFGSPELMGYEEAFPITTIRIRPLVPKFAEELSHRDYLGALMNLGIERELLGDIMIKDKTAFLFCLSHIADYICENLDKVRHTNVKCELMEETPEEIRPSLEPMRVVMSSLRVDGILAKVYHLSRSQSIDLFREKKIYVNGRLCENNSYNCKEGDVISARGYGKFIFKQVSGKTGKDRFVGIVECYV